MNYEEFRAKWRAVDKTDLLLRDAFMKYQWGAVAFVLGFVIGLASCLILG